MLWMAAPLPSVLRMADYGGAGELGNPGGVIRAAIVNNNDLVHILLCLEDYAADISCLIIGSYAGQTLSP